MRIAVDARELQGKPTGVGRFLAAVLREWKTVAEGVGHSVVTLTPDYAGGTAWEQLILPRLVRSSGADVLFSPAYSGPVLSPVPMVVLIHDVSFFAHPEWFSWREGVRRRTTTRLSARAASRVITVSEFSKREISTLLGIEHSRIAVAYPGVTTFSGSASATSAGRPNRKRVLFVGSIFNRRRVVELIEGFARLARRMPDVDLSIIGENRTLPRIDLAATVSAHGMAGRIRLQNYITDEDLRAAYQSASVFVFLSDYEGFGLTPLEAMAANVPVLLLDTPVAREVCGEAARYIPAPAPLAIEQALESLLNDETERRRLINASRTVLSRYDWRTCSHQILNVLLESVHG